MRILLSPIHELQSTAKEVLKQAANDKVFLFFGEMGAGKTTFIKAMAEVLGVRSSVSSPTFSLINEYEYPEGLVYHFDCYRLKTPTEALDFGLEEYLYSGHYCFIEWPEKIEGLWPERYLSVSIRATDDPEIREIQLEHIG